MLMSTLQLVLEESQRSIFIIIGFPLWQLTNTYIIKRKGLLLMEVTLYSISIVIKFAKLFETWQQWAGEMAKCLLSRHKYLSLDIRYPLKS